MKITVLGDIMCEPCVLHAGKTKDGYSFDEICSSKQMPCDPLDGSIPYRVLDADSIHVLRT